MKLEEQQNIPASNRSGTEPKRKTDEESIKALKEMTVKLCSNDITIARLAAFNLSWMQEDGLAILTNILNGDFSRTSKKAAAYGLRSMKGRMRKLAAEVLQKGLRSRDRTTKAACIKALSLINKPSQPKENPAQKAQGEKIRIQEIRKKPGTDD
jgi:hypothetical protein